MLHAVGKTHPVQGLQGQVVAVVRPDALVNQGQLHVLQHRQGLNQVVLLEDEADLLVADAAELRVRQLPDVGAVQEVVPPCGDVQAAQDVHHGGLAGAGLAHDGHEFPPLYGEGNPVQGPDLAFKTLAVDLEDVLQFNQICHISNPRGRPSESG